MLILRLVFKDNSSISFGDPWKEPDGSVAIGDDGAPLPCKVGGIFFQAEESDDVSEEDEPASMQTVPAHYIVVAAPDRGSILESSGETRVRKYSLSDVKYCEEAWPLDLVNNFMQEEIQALVDTMQQQQQPQQPQPQQPQPQQPQPQQQQQPQQPQQYPPQYPPHQTR